MAFLASLADAVAEGIRHGVVVWVLNELSVLWYHNTVFKYHSCLFSTSYCLYHVEYVQYRYARRGVLLLYRFLYRTALGVPVLEYSTVQYVLYA